MKAEVEKLFHELADLSPEARSQYLADQRIEEETRRELEALLAFDAGASAFLIGDVRHAAIRSLRQLEAKSSQCGPYRLLELVGRGGMGAVYLAERADGEVTQRVAVKLLPAGAGDPLRERFLQERQILASLAHPHIARMLDAGHTGDGQPFLAMEYVEGKPIDVFAAGSSLRQKVNLMRKICLAVGYLHRNLIVHRDLKPSNILVTPDGEPKLLDFGIAKILDQPTDSTRTSMRMLTPDYASPEQVSGGRVTTATDIYSLGAVMYRLVTGKPAHEFEDRSADAIASSITSREVTRPSKWSPEVKGDIEFILLKALRKDPQERYETAEQFAADLEAFLESRPVRARSGNAWYSARKWIRRHWIPAGAAAIVVAGLATGFYIARMEAAVAEREAASAQAVNEFLQNDLLSQASAASQSGPKMKPDPDLKVRTVLDRAAARIGGKFERQPDVEASIRETIGQSYMDLGLYAEARTHLQRALELRRRTLGANHPKTVKTVSRLGYVAYLQGRYPDAEALFHQSLEAQRRTPGLENPDSLYSMNGLAIVYAREGKYAKAEELFRQTYEIGRKVQGPQDPRTLTSMHSLALIYNLLGKYPQAEAMARETLALRQRVLGGEHPNTIDSIIALGVIYVSEAKYEQADRQYNEALAIQRRVLGPEHPSTLISMNNLAEVYYSEGKYQPSETLAAQTLDLMRRIDGPEHAYTLQAMDVLAKTYAFRGKYAEAENMLSQSIAIRRRKLGVDNPETLTAVSLLGLIYQCEGKYDLAETEAAQALAGRRRVLGSNHVETVTSAAKLAIAYVSLGKFAEAEPLAREAWEFHRKQMPDDWGLYRAESLVGESLAGRKQYAEAEPLLLEGYRGMLARKSQMAAADGYYLKCAAGWIVDLYQVTGQPAKAAAWRKEAAQWRDAILAR